MRMNKPGVALASLMLLILLLAPAAGAEEHEDTITLVPLKSEQFQIDNRDGKTFTISYEVEVLEGVPISVYFMDQEGHDNFTAGEQFDAYTKYSAEDTRSFKESFQWEKTGYFYIVITNIGPESTDNSTVSYKVSWNELGFFGETPWYVCVGIIVAIVVIVVFAYWRWGP